MGEKNNYIKERILEIAKYHKISLEKFFPDIGMTYGSFKGNLKKSSVNSDALAILLAKYPDVNSTWLLTGEGEMLRDSSEQSAEPSREDRLLAIIESQQDTIKELSKKLK